MRILDVYSGTVLFWVPASLSVRLKKTYVLSLASILLFLVQLKPSSIYLERTTLKMRSFLKMGDLSYWVWEPDIKYVEMKIFQALSLTEYRWRLLPRDPWLVLWVWEDQDTQAGAYHDHGSSSSSGILTSRWDQAQAPSVKRPCRMNPPWSSPFHLCPSVWMNLGEIFVWTLLFPMCTSKFHMAMCLYKVYWMK